MRVRRDVNDNVIIVMKILKGSIKRQCWLKFFICAKIMWCVCVYLRVMNNSDKLIWQGRAIVNKNVMYFVFVSLINERG